MKSTSEIEILDKKPKIWILNLQIALWNINWNLKSEILNEKSVIWILEWLSWKPMAYGTTLTPQVDYAVLITGRGSPWIPNRDGLRDHTACRAWALSYIWWCRPREHRSKHLYIFTELTSECLHISIQHGACWCNPFVYILLVAENYPAKPSCFNLKSQNWNRNMKKQIDFGN